MRDSEIHQPHIDGVAVDEHDVLRLDIAVNDPPLVRVFERPAELDADLEDVPVGERLLAIELAQGLTLDVFRHKEGPLRFADHLVDGQDVRMVELGRGLGLPHHSVLDVGSMLDHFDGHRPPHLDIVRQIDGGERPAPQLADHAVAFEKEIGLRHRPSISGRPALLGPRLSSLVLPCFARVTTTRDCCAEHKRVAFGMGGSFWEGGAACCSRAAGEAGAGAGFLEAEVSPQVPLQRGADRLHHLLRGGGGERLDAEDITDGDKSHQGAVSQQAAQGCARIIGAGDQLAHQYMLHELRGQTSRLFVLHSVSEDDGKRMTGFLVLPQAADHTGQPFTGPFRIALEDAPSYFVDVDRPLHGRLQQALLGREVVHDKSGVDPGLLGDCADARRVVAGRCKELPGSLQDQPLRMAPARTPASADGMLRPMYAPVLPRRAYAGTSIGLPARVCHRAVPASTTNDPATHRAKIPRGQPTPAPSK